MLLGVFAHVQLDQGVLVAEQELRQRLGELGLADAGWAGEDERPARPLRILQSGPRTPDRPGQRAYGVVLADVALAQLVLHPQQSGRLLLGQLEDRDARRGGQHLGDDLFVDLSHHVQVAGLPLRLAFGPGGEQLLLVVAQPGRPLEVLSVDGGFLLQTDRGHLLVELPQVRWCRHPADPQPGAGLVDQVDGLVRQEAVGDVAVGHLRRGDQRLVGDGHPVVSLIAIPQPTQDVDGVGDGRLGHLNRLETTFQRGVLFDVLAVLVEGGRANGLQFAAGQHRLENAGGIDRALGGSRAHQSVDLIDKQHDVAAGLDLLEHLLESLFEVTAIAATGHQGTEVQRVDLFVAQGFGNVAADNGLRQALDHGRLSDPGLADQDRIVLGAPAQYRHHPLDLGLPPDHRVEFVLPRRLGQVTAELVQHHRRGRGTALLGSTRRGRLFALETTEQLQDLVPHTV